VSNLRWIYLQWRMSSWWWERNETGHRLAISGLGNFFGSDHPGIHSAGTVSSRRARVAGTDAILLRDLASLNVVDGHVEIALGWSIVVFVFFGLFAHGLQPAFLGGRWWLHIPLSALCTIVYLALQFVMICFRRQGIFFNETVAWLILSPGLIAAALAPLVHLTVIKTAPSVGGSTRLQAYRIDRIEQQ
jgi:hypothetical protein